VEKGMLRRNAGWLKAVDGVTFDIHESETLGMVGESGCGKSTIGKALLRAFPVTAGQLVYNFEDREVDVSSASPGELRGLGFRRRTQMIFQDPNSSLDPRMTVLDLISEPLHANGELAGGAIKDRVAYLMDRVGLDHRYMKRYPHAFSGGQRQRISIARALSTNPRFIVADEPTSALDVSIQAQILNLMTEIQKEFNLTFLFVSHNLGVIRHVADRVAVVYLGRIVELAANDELFERPKHPYTAALLQSIPLADPTIASGLEAAPGEIGNPLNPPSGCSFHPRCAWATQTCREAIPELCDASNAHFVACHHAAELMLQGIQSKTGGGARP
ncbi:MAG: peptide/nickel transport system ATP-binding protein, partial [Chloroflexota bacterium]|nr:peptide/nickel transport system ATP-binding protein [Chloroflexota bacterium]